MKVIFLYLILIFLIIEYRVFFNFLKNILKIFNINVKKNIISEN